MHTPFTQTCTHDVPESGIVVVLVVVMETEKRNSDIGKGREVLFDGDVIKAANTEAIKSIRFLLEDFLHESNGG